MWTSVNHVKLMNNVEELQTQLFVRTRLVPVPKGIFHWVKHCYEGEIWNPQYKSEMENKLSEFERKGETFSLRNTMHGYKHKPIYNNFTRKINEYENVLFILFS